MAIQTKNICNFNDGADRIDILYDDAALIITRVHVVLGTPGGSITATLVRDSDGRVYSRTFGPGPLDQSLDLPTNGAQRLGYTIDSHGRLTGFSKEFSYAAP